MRQGSKWDFGSERWPIYAGGEIPPPTPPAPISSSSRGEGGVNQTVRPPATHEVYASTSEGAKRIFGRLKEGRFIVDHIGDHL